MNQHQFYYIYGLQDGSCWQVSDLFALSWQITWAVQGDMSDLAISQAHVSKSDIESIWRDAIMAAFL